MQSTRDLLAEPIALDVSAIAQVARLPAHHRDPFDRLIISQALVADHVILTSDSRFAAYGVSVIG